MSEDTKRVKILTVCRAGLCRSVGLADVLKHHFDPVDVIPMGSADCFQSTETKNMLSNWADHIVVMEPKYKERIAPEYQHKVLICDVGPDTYRQAQNPLLIDKVWRWTRQHTVELGIVEHNRKQ